MRLKQMETLEHVWSPAPVDLILEDNEIHVWRVQLEQFSSHARALRSVLADDELARASRFSFEIDRRQFMAARGILRAILSQYVHIPPGELRFHYNQYGKPFLAPQLNPYRLNFNLSHSGGLALYAITRNMEIGVDVERVRSDFEYEEIAKCFFSWKEAAFLSMTSTDMKPDAFYDCWTRKEAYIKAHGKGLSLPLDSFDVSFPLERPEMFLLTQEDSQQRFPWTVLSLRPGPGYVGALAARGVGHRFRYWEWDQAERI